MNEVEQLAKFLTDNFVILNKSSMLNDKQVLSFDYCDLVDAINDFFSEKQNEEEIDNRNEITQVAFFLTDNFVILSKDEILNARVLSFILPMDLVDAINDFFSEEQNEGVQQTCLIPCNESRIENGLCDCYNQVNLTPIAEFNSKLNNKNIDLDANC